MRYCTMVVVGIECYRLCAIIRLGGGGGGGPSPLVVPSSFFPMYEIIFFIISAVERDVLNSRVTLLQTKPALSPS